MADQLIQGTTLIEDKRSERGEVLSISPLAFHGQNPDVDDITYAQETGAPITVVTGGGLTIMAPVNLPHGVTVTSVIVYGNDPAGNTWYMNRGANDGGTNGTTMATAAVNTQDTTISNAVVDNIGYNYLLWINGMGATDAIYGAVIKYEY